MLIGGISPYSKVVELRVVNCSKNFQVGIYFKMLKVVNTTVPKNNPFYQYYSFTTFGVGFYHLLVSQRNEIVWQLMK